MFEETLARFPQMQLAGKPVMAESFHQPAEDRCRSRWRLRRSE